MVSLENFEMGVTLGTGSFGRVKLAKLKQTNSTAKPLVAAIKMLKKKEVIRLQQVEHMNAEREILMNLSTGSNDLTPHTFIVQLFATFKDDCYLYMVLEYINGGEFFTHLRKAGCLKNDQCKFYAASVTSIFQHLHKSDIIYRDLKPENLLLDSTGYLKITDFGFAKVVNFKTYTLCGTPEYIAPEVLLNKGHGKGVDWWTLGILMFEMLAGQPPFVDDDPMGIYQQILGGKIHFPKAFERHAKTLIKKLLNADLTKRYGCLKQGAVDIIKSKFFQKFSFEDLLARKLTAPLEIKVKGDDDTTNFDPYPDSTDKAEAVKNCGEAFDQFAWCGKYVAEALGIEPGLQATQS